MSARIDVPAFVKAVRPKNPEELTPADLQAFLLFLIADAALVKQSILDFVLAGGAGKIVIDDDKMEVVKQIENDIVLYQERLNTYLEYVNEEIAEGAGGAGGAAIPVVNPLLRGRFPKTHRLPGGNDDVLCHEGEDCYDTYPDIATAAIVRNELVEFEIFNRYHQEQFLRDIEENGEKILAAPSIVLEKALPSNAPWKWALWGGGVSVGLLALYKLLK